MVAKQHRLSAAARKSNDVVDKYHPATSALVGVVEFEGRPSPKATEVID